jgi:hypothetical protein
MGRVRFYTQNGENYCTLRVEQDGLYLLEGKVRMHSERKKMPPKSNGVSRETMSNAKYVVGADDPDLLEKIVAVLDDLQETFRLDPKGMATLKPSYKKIGCDFSVKYREDWHTDSGACFLEALISYYDTTIAEDNPPPTPLRKGGRE